MGSDECGGLSGRLSLVLSQLRNRPYKVGYCDFKGIRTRLIKTMRFNDFKSINQSIDKEVFTMIMRDSPGSGSKEKCKNKRFKAARKFVLGMGLGAAAGVALGIIFAPRSGKETREDFEK